MNKYEKIYLKATKRGGGSAASWLDSSVAALAVDLEEHTGKPVEVSGPFGLRAEIVIKAETFAPLSPHRLKTAALSSITTLGREQGNTSQIHSETGTDLTTCKPRSRTPLKKLQPL